MGKYYIRPRIKNATTKIPGKQNKSQKERKNSVCVESWNTLKHQGEWNIQRKERV